MSEFLDRMKTAAKADRKKIVLPEGEDPRTIAARARLLTRGLPTLSSLATPPRSTSPALP